MTEEKAIDNIKEIIELVKEDINNKDTTVILDTEDLKSLKIVLNLIDKKEWLYQRALSDVTLADKEIQKKDKQIDLMAKKISDDDVGEFYYWTKEQIKQYFEQKAKEV